MCVFGEGGTDDMRASANATHPVLWLARCGCAKCSVSCTLYLPRYRGTQGTYTDERFQAPAQRTTSTPATASQQQARAVLNATQQPQQPIPRHSRSQSYALTMADVPMRVVSDDTSSERRITPSWSVSTLKAKLESVTGIPPSCQRLSLRVTGQQSVPVEAVDEDAAYLTSFGLVPYAELHVSGAHVDGYGQACLASPERWAGWMEPGTQSRLAKDLVDSVRVMLLTCVLGAGHTTTWSQA